MRSAERSLEEVEGAIFELGKWWMGRSRTDGVR